MIKKNIVKGWVTSLIGTATMVITLYLVFNKSMSFVWDGVVGLLIGCVLLLAPKTVEQKVSELIKSWGRKNDPFGSYNENQTD